jgi:glucose-1-phosphate thymidylyltransferase
MKAVILAGGTGSRLFPTTYVINKHLLPIYNKPMIYYPLSLVMLTKIREVVFVVNPEDIPLYKKLFGEGENLGMKIMYAVQEKPLGLAHALLTAEKFINDGEVKHSVCLVLGDNIFFGHGIAEILYQAKDDVEKNGGAYVFGYFVKDPERYGVVEFDSGGRVISIEEKPKNPKSNFAVVGLYFYDNTVFEKAKKIKPSWRGELEITSVNEEYLKERKLKVKLLGRGFAWFDAGTHDSFLEAGEFVATIEKKTGLMIGCIEEIAYRNGWISKQKLEEIAKKLSKTDYGEYLIKILKE